MLQLLRALTKLSAFALFVFLFQLANISFAQKPACTDLFSANFMQKTKNDSSCSYPLTLRQPKMAFQLQDRLRESSGLIFYKGLLWSHNDSDGEASIFGMDTLDGSIKSIITISNAVNNDWEDLAQDEEYIYIADFGNNAGARKDLAIYKLDKKQIDGSPQQQLEAEKITFHYPEQEKFFPRWKQHNFDCEALIAGESGLFLFTKNWKNAQTDLYALPKTAGDYPALHLGNFDCDGVVTGADLNTSTGVLALVGYDAKFWRPFVILFYDFEEEAFFGGFSRKIELTNLITTQTEGICFVSEDELMISAEYSQTFSARVFKLPIGQWTNKRDFALRKGENGKWLPQWFFNPDELIIQWEQMSDQGKDQFFFLVDEHGKTIHQSKVSVVDGKSVVNLPKDAATFKNSMAILAGRNHIYYATPQIQHDEP